MSLEELKTAAMAALYGPLAKGAEKERWRRVEVTPTDADAKSEDSWASEKEEKEESERMDTFGEWLEAQKLPEHLRLQVDE